MVTSKRGVVNVCIGIQARSTSSRFPGKVFEMIGDKEMLRHVVDAADSAAFYANRFTHRDRVQMNYAVLCPKGDPIKKKYETRSMVIEGPELDVLTRYVILAKQLSADYVVRITGDCPLLPAKLITLLVKKTIANGYDYFSNVDPKFRTSPDGHDVEIISRRAIEWANEHAQDPSDREHVTTIFRTSKFVESPEKFTHGHTVDDLDRSHIKLSVDTIDDLEAVRVEYSRRTGKLEVARSYYGKSNVHQV